MMINLSQTPSKPANFWPNFTDDQTVGAMKLFDLVEWVSASDRVLDGHAEAENMPIIAMPPMQRTAVWRPKQVLDLWDSLMRGLPIGTFYLVEQSGGVHDPVRIKNAGYGNPRTKIQDFNGKLFELLDGQQRVRALLAGIYEPAGQNLCLWVKFGVNSAGQSPCLRITSKAQPFGYDEKSGGKLRLEHRRDARLKIEPDQEAHPLRCGDRPAYDLDLFDGPVTQDRTPIEQPPRPYDATGTEKIVKLHQLLAAWTKCLPSSAEEGARALRCALPEAWKNDDGIDSALQTLHGAFRNIKNAQVALLRIKPSSFDEPEQTLLTLFERVGAGGTPLSAEERLFSIYKHHVPEIRYAVDAIYGRVGRLLPPTKIAAAALRIANASIAAPRYTVPDVIEFSEQMAAGPASELWKKLNQLIPGNPASDKNKDNLLSNGFVAIKELLSDTSKGDAFWMPDVVLAALPAELWQVLVFWATRVLGKIGEGADFASSREEVVRFALFWHFFGWNNEKAARWAFAHISGMKETTHFPGFALYCCLIGTKDSDRCACALIDPAKLTDLLCKQRVPGWRTEKERFGENSQESETGAHWWWSGRKVLPWLQRTYISRVFPGYAPLTEHEDDLPYDVDHICPYKDWGFHWAGVQNHFDNVEPAIRQKMGHGRHAVGNGIGNFRLIESSTNKSQQDDDVSKKMPFVLVQTENLTTCDKQKMADWAFSVEHRAFWEKVSRPGEGPNRKWDNDRLAAFQEAVEQRTAWLYQQFHDSLGLGAWISAQSQGDTVEAGPVQDLDPVSAPPAAG